MRELTVAEYRDLKPLVDRVVEAENARREAVSALHRVLRLMEPGMRDGSMQFDAETMTFQVAHAPTDE